MASTYLTGRNPLYGKRKRTPLAPRGFASSLSRNLYFKKGPQRSSMPMTVQSFDKAFSRSLKSRNIATPEQKFKEVEVATTVSATSALTLINGMATGDANQTRDGLKIKVTKIEFEANMILSASASGGFDRGKVSLFIDKQANGASPIFSSIIGSSLIAPYTSSTGSTPFLKNGTFDDQFYIIKDWDYCLDAQYSGQRDCAHLKCNIPLTRIVQYNNGNAGTVADIITNAMYVGYIGGQTAGATATSLSFLVRIWYTDA